jgi:hypothetical protein
LINFFALVRLDESWRHDTAARSAVAVEYNKSISDNSLATKRARQVKIITAGLTFSR